MKVQSMEMWKIYKKLSDYVLQTSPIKQCQYKITKSATVTLQMQVTATD